MTSPTTTALRRYRPYPEYKDSGVEWLGEIPAHWEAVPVRSLARQGYKTFTDGDWIESPFIRDEGVRLIQTGNVGIGVYKEQGYRYIDDATFRAFRCTEVLPGDVLICRLADPVGRACLAPHLGTRMITSVDVCIVKPASDVYAPFAVYALSGDRYLSWMSGICRGGTRDRISRSMLGAMRVQKPLLPEQRAIALFLDRETAKIDALIAKKERLIELLQEKRSALITQAVTKGLDPNVPMKDSGVEWLGEIPVQWEVERIKWAARMESGHTPDKKVESYWAAGDIPWVSLADTGQLRNVDYIQATAVNTTADGLAHSSAHVLPSGTVVFSRDATVGLCAITRAGMAVSQHFIGWVCTDRLQPEYLLFALRSMTHELERLTMGATVRTIGMPDVRSLTTPIPPLSEQQKIVDHVLTQRAKFDGLVATVRAAIVRVKELRTALISAAVTGKIDVREEAA